MGTKANRAGRPREIERGEDGHAALYTLLLLPIVLSLTSLAVDVSGWNALRDKLQHESDRLALQAANLLPDTDAAAGFVLRSAAELPGSDVSVETFLPAQSGTAFGVRLRANYQPAFDFFVSAFAGKAFTVERSSVAQVVPTDYVLILSDGASLRPPLAPQAGSPGRFNFPAWGSELDWPASGYFSCVQPPRHSELNALGWKWWEDWNRPDFRRWATQSCFNPVLSALKETGVGVAESLLSLRANRMSVVFTPGETSNRGYRVARHIRSGADDPQAFNENIGGFPPPQLNSAEASWGGYLELDQLLGDEVCMLLANPVTSFTDHYTVQTTRVKRPNCTDPIDSTLCGTRHFVTGHFTDCYLHASLSVAEAIYWDAAKLAIPGFAAEPNIPQALSAAWNELTNSGSLASPSPAELEIRGNLAFSALRKVLLVTDSLPEPRAGNPSIDTILELYRSAQIELIVVPYFHDGLSSAERSQLEARTKALQERAAADGSHNRTLRVLPAENSRALYEEIGAKLVALGRQLAIRS